MLEPGETKVNTEEGEEWKYPAKFNKKKHGKNNKSAKRVDQDQDMPELLKGIEFSMAKNRVNFLTNLVMICLFVTNLPLRRQTHESICTVSFSLYILLLFLHTLGTTAIL